jgi:hypothetical protein
MKSELLFVFTWRDRHNCPSYIKTEMAQQVLVVYQVSTFANISPGIFEFLPLTDLKIAGDNKLNHYALNRSTKAPRKQNFS